MSSTSGVESDVGSLVETPAKPDAGSITESRPGSEAPTHPLIIEACELGLKTSRGWVFRDVDLTLLQHGVAALVGPAGMGKSALLLALSGRMRVSTGRLCCRQRRRRAGPGGARTNGRPSRGCRHT